MRLMSVSTRPNELACVTGDRAARAVRQPAVVAGVRVTGDHEVHRIIETAHDRTDRRVRVADQVALAVVDEVVRRRALEAALVDQHDDGLHAQTLELLHRRVDRLHFVAELEARDAGGRNDRRGVLEREADEAHAHAADDLDAERREQRLAGGRARTRWPTGI